jgi:hypothetical protein
MVRVVGAEAGPDITHRAAIAPVLLGANLRCGDLTFPREAVHLSLRVTDLPERAGRVSHWLAPARAIR